MKNSLLALLIVLYSIPGFAQITFQKAYGDFTYDDASSFTITSDSGYCIVGATGVNQTDSLDVAIYKTNENGDLVWSGRISGHKDDLIRDVALTQDNGFILVGQTRSSPLDTSNFDILAIKIDDFGFQEWMMVYGGVNNDYANKVLPTPDGGFLILGGTMSFGTAQESALALKISASGVQQWASINSISNTANRYWSADYDRNGGYILGGLTGDGSALLQVDPFISQINDAGTIGWSLQLGTLDVDRLRDVKSTADSGYVIAGDTYAGGNGDQQIIRLDKNRNVLWSKRFGNAEDDKANSILEIGNGHFIIGGYTNIGSMSQPYYQMTLIELDNNGTLISSRSYGEISSRSITEKVLRRSDGYALCGSTIGFNDPQGDAFLVKTDFNKISGCFEGPLSLASDTLVLLLSGGGTSSQITVDEFPVNFSFTPFINQFGQNCFSNSLNDDPILADLILYPVPAGNQLKLTLPYSIGDCRIEIVDLSGRIQKKLNVQNLQEQTIQTSDLTNGMYFIKVQHPTGVFSKSFIKQ